MLVFAPPIRTFEFKIVELEGGETVWDGPDGFSLSCFRTQHTVYSLGWLFQEPARPGRFDAAEALRRGVPSGPLLGALQRGENVTLADGREVLPEGLTGAPQPGRKLVLTSDTEPSLGVLDAACGADLLVTEATFLRGDEEEARLSKHTVSYQAGRLAAAAKVRSLALTHVSSRYPAEQAAVEARECFGEVSVPADFDELEIPYAEKGFAALIAGGARHPKAAAAPAGHATALF
jgi:ribonuclease Z